MSLTPNVGGYLKLDSKEVERNLRRLNAQILPRALKKGLKQAVLQLYDDSVTKMPTVPRKTGALRASASAFVQNVLVRKWGANAADSHTVQIGPNEYIAVLGFNLPYAHRQHQVQHRRYTTPGSGALYLKIKIETYARDYVAIVVEIAKREMTQR